MLALPEHVRDFFQLNDWKHEWKKIHSHEDIVLREDPVAHTGPYPLSEIFSWLYSSWQKDTSSDPEHWFSRNKAWGQCAASSMFLHMLFRDQEPVEIVNCRAFLPDGRDISHYGLQFLLTQIVLDLTKQQFPQGTTYSEWKVKRKDQSNGWNYVTMASSSTWHRYNDIYDSSPFWAIIAERFKKSQYKK